MPWVTIQSLSENGEQPISTRHDGYGPLPLPPSHLYANLIPQVEAAHRTAKGHYPNTNKHNPEQDIARRTRRVEVMTYWDEILSPPPEPRPSRYEVGERTRMSETAAESESILAFVGQGRFRTADPAKAVRSRDALWLVANNSFANVELYRDAPQLCSTMDNNA